MSVCTNRRWGSPKGLRYLLPKYLHAELHLALIERADALVGCAVGSDEEAELERLTIAIEAYEAKRWPSGKAVGGKG